MRTSRNMEDWSRRILAVVALASAKDPGGWVPAQHIFDQVGPTVPPGRALRAYQLAQRQGELERLRRAARGGATGPRRPAWPEADQIRMGRREVLNTCLATLVSNGWLEREGTRAGRRFRISGERLHADYCCLHGGSCRARPGEDASAHVVEAVATEDFGGPAYGADAPPGCTCPGEPDACPVPGAPHHPSGYEPDPGLDLPGIEPEVTFDLRSDPWAYDLGGLDRCGQPDPEGVDP